MKNLVILGALLTTPLWGQGEDEGRTPIRDAQGRLRGFEGGEERRLGELSVARPYPYSGGAAYYQVPSPAYEVTNPYGSYPPPYPYAPQAYPQPYQQANPYYSGYQYQYAPQAYRQASPYYSGQPFYPSTSPYQNPMLQPY